MIDRVLESRGVSWQENVGAAIYFEGLYQWTYQGWAFIPDYHSRREWMSSRAEFLGKLFADEVNKRGRS